MDILCDDTIRYIADLLDLSSAYSLSRVCVRYRQKIIVSAPATLDNVLQETDSLSLLQWYESLSWTASPADGTEFHLNYNPSDKSTVIAVEQGNLAMLQWLHSLQALLSVSTFEAAVIIGNMPIIQWLHEQKCPHGGLIATAAKHGQLIAAQWLCDRGNSPVGSEVTLAVINGHLDMLKWLCKQGCRLQDNLFDTAIRAGHLNVLQWLRKKGQYWSEISWYTAAMGGHLHILQWLQEQGCPIDSRSITVAASRGHLKVVKWLVKQGCQLTIPLFNTAASDGQLAVVQWLVKKRCPMNSVIAYTNAAGAGRLPVMAYLKTHFDKMNIAYPWNAELFNYVISRGHMTVLQWLVDEACPYQIEDACTVAINERRITIMRWLRSRNR